jgi:hypothetical protein
VLEVKLLENASESTRLLGLQRSKLTPAGFRESLLRNTYDDLSPNGCEQLASTTMMPYPDALTNAKRMMNRLRLGIFALPWLRGVARARERY